VKRKRIGIFGGTFDPPHISHLILADEACHQMSLDHLLFVLTPDPPHKQRQSISSLPDRLELLTSALQDSPDYEISTIEIDRPGPHYAVDTLHLLAGKYPDADLIYLMGGDSLGGLPSWHKSDSFLAACHRIGVMRRPQDLIQMEVLESAMPGLAEKVRFIEAPLLEISSRRIRQRIREGRPWRRYLPQAVAQVIEARGLYR
jgi:nicotinate-nucleotide adenylyltransferase